MIEADAEELILLLEEQNELLRKLVCLAERNWKLPNGYLKGVGWKKNDNEKPQNKAVATRKMVDAGVKALFEEERPVFVDDSDRDLVVKIYRAMKDAE